MGEAIAAATSGYGLHGPGPIKIRSESGMAMTLVGGATKIGGQRRKLFDRYVFGANFEPSMSSNSTSV